jgi:glycosyltransferase involved in cell wall biosynthesis
MLPGGQNGGVKPAILEFLKGLRALLGDQLQYLFLTADDTHEESASILGQKDSAICVLSRAGRSQLMQTIDLATRSKWIARELMRKHGIEVLYCPFGVLNFGSNRIPTVAMIVDILHRDYPYSLPVQTREWRELQFLKLTRAADHFQVISQFSAERLQALYKVSQEQIFVTRLPIHGRLVSRKSMREPFFLYPANFWVHKNHEVLLVAYQIYLLKSGRESPWDLVLTGYLDERARELRRIAEDLGVAARVQFRGHVPEEELARLYSTASCLVFPSLYEGYGIPIAEAMGFGVPIICGRNGSIPEIAGNAALYEDVRNPEKLADALVSIARDEVLRSELAERGRERIVALDFSPEVRKLAKIFITAAARGHRAKRKSWNEVTVFFSTLAYYRRSVARHALNLTVEIPLRFRPRKESNPDVVLRLDE